MAKPFLKLLIFLAIGVGAAYFQPDRRPAAPEPVIQADTSGFTDPALIQQAYNDQRSNLQVKQAGTVTALLKDDRHGPRHQRFIIRLSSGQKLLIAHNIDLAPKIEDLKPGDAVTFSGEYEWNNKGGVVHWTHRDPARHHADGWLIHNNLKYD